MAETWEANLRAAIRGANGPGWTARSGGPSTTQLIYRPPHPLYHGKKVHEPKPQQSGRLEIAWSIRNREAILKAATTAGRIVSKGTHLAEACRIAYGNTPLGPRLDWEAVVDRFRAHRTGFTGEVSVRTWDRMHAPAFRKLVALLHGPEAPTTARAALEAFPWAAPGSSRRRQQAQTICRMFTWATNLGITGPEWDPPRASNYYGAKQRQPVAITGALSDTDIELLLGNLHQAHWWWLFTAMSLYGLRPEETVHLQMRGEELWCNYQKRSSGGITKPRRLYALEPFPGLEERWLSRWHLHRRLPDLGRKKGRVGLSMTIYLRRHPTWLELKDADPTRKLVPYSFRHAYALRGAARGIPPRMMAAAMGHTLSTHLKAYSRFMDAGSMEAAFSSASSPTTRAANPAEMSNSV